MDTKTVSFGERYRVDGIIGEGGMGRVFRVFDLARNEEIALKEMSRAYIESPSASLHFKNEFRIMSRFNHPGTVKVYDFGVSVDGIPFITMEHIGGTSLSELHSLPVGKVTEIMAGILQILRYIHSRLYVHRDLKPQNIKILENGEVKLLDYGLMNQLGVPSSGKIAGTYHYLAPEVIAGGFIDAATDLYSLGIIGYELLIGKPPFTGGRSEILKGHLSTVPPRVSELRTDVHSALVSVIAKLLEKDKSRRYAGASEVLDDLSALCAFSGPYETVEQKQGYLYSSSLVGRENEMDSFRGKLESISRGTSASLFLGAVAGVGKTRLMKEMKILTEVEGIGCLELDHVSAGEKIYGWLELLLHQLVPLANDDEKKRLGKALSAFSPELRAIFGDASEIPSDPEITGSLLDMLTAITARAPIGLFIDDIHMMDPKSLKVINEIIRRSGSIRILAVATFRDNEVDKASPLWHTVEEGLTEYRRLGTLGKTDVKALISHLLHPTTPSEEFLDICFRNSGGNAFDLMEFLRYLVMAGSLTHSGNQWLEPVDLKALQIPATVEDGLMVRIEKLGAQARELAQAASVLRDALSLESWQSVSSMEPDEFLDLTGDLIDNQIMIRAEGEYCFAHDRIREILYNRLESGIRKSFHLRAADYLRMIPEKGQKSRNPSVIAWHYTEAEERHSAISYSLEAAAEAQKAGLEWEAFHHFRNAVRFLEQCADYPDRESIMQDIYQKTATFSSAAWIDAATCLAWMKRVIDHYIEKKDMEKVFSISLSYIVNSAITSNYAEARNKIEEAVRMCDIREGTLPWAIFFGAGVCLVDWYQGYQNDCFDHAVSAIGIFERSLETLPADVWPAYSWALFWRDKARAYLGKPVVMENIEKIRRLMTEGKSDRTIYWHTLTAVGARAAFTGCYAELLEWKQLVSQLSKEMGKIHWFECWISHSFLYGALHHGELSQLEDHIERVQASPDPYQVRLAWLFRGRLRLDEGRLDEAEKNLTEFLAMEDETPDNSYMEGLIYLAETHMRAGEWQKARALMDRGLAMSSEGKYANPLYRMQFIHLLAKEALHRGDCSEAAALLEESCGLAGEYDNTIQKAFIKASIGGLSRRRDDRDGAVKALTEAYELFMSLANKYQAGRVLAEIESLAGREESARIARDSAMRSARYEKTVTEDSPVETTAGEEEKTAVKSPDSRKPAVDGETDMGRSEYGDTEFHSVKERNE